MLKQIRHTATLFSMSLLILSIVGFGFHMHSCSGCGDDSRLFVSILSGSDPDSHHCCHNDTEQATCSSSCDANHACISSFETFFIPVFPIEDTQELSLLPQIYEQSTYFLRGMTYPEEAVLDMYTKYTDTSPHLLGSSVPLSILFETFLL